MGIHKITFLAIHLVIFIGLGFSDTYAQCTATIADGNGSFNDNQIGWSSSSGSTAVQPTPAPEGPSTDGGAYLRPTTAGSTESVNIAMGSLIDGGIYVVDWEAIHGLASTSSNYPDSAIYIVKILDGGTTMLSQDFVIDDDASWVPQTLSFTSSSTNLIFQIQLLGSNFSNGSYKMGIDGMVITCNGTTRPCDLVAPTYRKR